MADTDTDPDTAPVKRPEIVYIDPAIPPGVSADIAFLSRQQAQQHYDRRIDARTTLDVMESAAQHTNKRLDKIDADLAAKPGKLEVRAIMGFCAAVFVVLLFAVFQLRGINTAEAVRDTRDLLNVAGAAAGMPAAPVSAPPPSSTSSTAADAPQGNGDHPPELP